MLTTFNTASSKDLITSGTLKNHNSISAQGFTSEQTVLEPLPILKYAVNQLEEILHVCRSCGFNPQPGDQIC